MSMKINQSYLMKIFVVYLITWICACLMGNFGVFELFYCCWVRLLQSIVRNMQFLWIWWWYHMILSFHIFTRCFILFIWRGRVRITLVQSFSTQVSIIFSFLYVSLWLELITFWSKIMKEISLFYGTNVYLFDYLLNHFILFQ